MREIEENAGDDATVGAVVDAIDDEHSGWTPNFLTYTLSGPDAASFNLGRGEPEVTNGAAAVGTVDAKDVGGQITAKKDLDYETKNEYTVIVTATDGSGASASITVTINVTDEEPETPKLVEPVVNADPEFATATTAREVAEGTVLGRNVGAPVRATDADDDTLSYSLSGTDAVSFAINSRGQITTRAVLDAATKSTYTVTVTADDGNGGTDTISVTITVTESGVLGDTNGDGSISKAEVIAAFQTYVRGSYTKAEIIGIFQQYVRDSS